MPKKSRFREPFERQHDNWAQTHLLINVNEIELEKVTLSDTKSL